MPFSLLCPSRRRNYRSRGSFISGNIVRRERRRQPSAALRLERFTFHPAIVFFPLLERPPSTPSPLLADTLIAVLISRTRLQFLLTIRGRCEEVIAVRNKVGITVGFLFIYLFFVPSLENHSPISPSTDRLRSCQSRSGRYELLTALCFSRKPKKKRKKKKSCAVCSSVRVPADCQKEGKNIHQKKSPPEKKRNWNSSARKGSRGSQSKPRQTAGERAGALALVYS